MVVVKNVYKRYGKQVAVKDVSFNVNKGEVIGFLGPNGAGKSTTMNIITGYISATEGVVEIDGINIIEKPEEAKKKIGYLPEIPPLYLDMTVEEYLDFVFDIKSADKGKANIEIKKIMELVKIDNVKGRRIGNLSKGYKQRVGLGQALVGDPELLILDEPTVGLDPHQIIDMRNLIKDIGKNRTIILSSHILPEVSAICDRVLIINKGEIVASGSPEELSSQLSCIKKIQIRIKGNDMKGAVEAIKSRSEINRITQCGVLEKGTIDIIAEGVKDTDIREATFLALTQAGYIILSMKGVDLSLEDIFLQVTNKSNEGGDI
jgi:ABC-2 type transport system ATP-binding protein